MTEVTDYRDYLSRSDEQLRQVDPLVMNLLVAKSIPSLASLNVQRYVDLRDEWAAALGQRFRGMT